MQAMKQPYFDTNPASTIVAYDIEDDRISIDLASGTQIVFTADSCGPAILEHLKYLARHGDGLFQYVRMAQPGVAEKIEY